MSKGTSRFWRWFSISIAVIACLYAAFLVFAAAEMGRKITEGLD